MKNQHFQKKKNNKRSGVWCDIHSTLQLLYNSYQIKMSWPCYLALAKGYVWVSSCRSKNWKPKEILPVILLFFLRKLKEKKDKYETYTHEDTNNTKKQHISEKKNYQNPTQNTNVRQREKERKKGNTTRCFD